MSEARPPHMLILMSDQHSVRFTEPYQSRNECTGLMTPQLNAMAEEGAVFENCYCNSPLCVPSRMSFMTAQHCHAIGVWGNGDPLASDIPTFAHGLGIAGYRTVLVGRMHFLGEDQRHGFQERRVGDVSSMFPGRNRAEYRWRGYWGVYDSIAHAGPGQAHDLNFDQAVAAEACRVIYEHETSGDERPLCLVASFYSPHDPYRVYESHFRPFEDKIGLPMDHRGQHKAPHPVQDRDRETFAPLSDDTVRAARIAYAGKTRFVDDLVGAIRTSFQESTLAQNALEMYLSDHGEMAGEHGLWTKGNFYEGAARVPLIVRAPGRIPAGTRIARPVSLVDVGPTLLDAADAPPLPAAAGQSLLDLTRGGEDDPQRPVYAELINPPRRMVRQARWKLNVYGEQRSELYDLRADPEELHDRAGDADCASIREQLMQLAHADGWDPNQVRAKREAAEPARRYLVRWSQAAGVSDPIQWGPAAPL